MNKFLFGVAIGYVLCFGTMFFWYWLREKYGG